MLPRRHLLRSLAGLLLALDFSLSGVAQTVASSPFLPPPGQVSATAPTPGATLEFRGFMVTPDGVKFSIYDPAKRAGTWVRLDEAGYAFKVKGYDAANDTVVVEQDGRTLNLKLHTAKIASLGNFVPATAPVTPSALTQSVVLNPTPADEAGRLGAVADEVRRRRALREGGPAAAGAPVQAQAVQSLPPPVVAPVKTMDQSQRQQGRSKGTRTQP